MHPPGTTTMPPQTPHPFGQFPHACDSTPTPPEEHTQTDPPPPKGTTDLRRHANTTAYDPQTDRDTARWDASSALLIDRLCVPRFVGRVFGFQGPCTLNRRHWNRPSGCRLGCTVGRGRKKFRLHNNDTAPVQSVNTQGKPILQASNQKWKIHSQSSFAGSPGYKGARAHRACGSLASSGPSCHAVPCP